MGNNKMRKGQRPPASMVSGEPPLELSRATKPSKPKSSKAKQESAQQLYDKGHLALAYENFDEARNCYRRATVAAPDDAEIVSAYGALLAEHGPVEEAIPMLRRAIKLAPSSGWDKYMYLAQLLEEDEPAEAIQLLQRGIDLLRTDATAATVAASMAEDDAEDGDDTCAEADALNSQLCKALCALSEQRMQIADEPIPEAVADGVVALLREAQTVNPNSPEPGQVLASLRYEQGRPDEALALLRQSMSLWFQPEDDEDDEDDDDERDCPAGTTADDAAMDEGADKAAAGVSGRGSDSSRAAGGRRSPAGGTAGGGAGGRGAENGGDDVAMEDADGKSAEGSDESNERGDVEVGEDEGEQEEGEEDMDEEEEAGGGEDELPSLEFRFECAKLLLELDETTTVAVQVLESLLAEEDSNPDVWHLLGLAYYSGGRFDEAQEAVDSAGLLIVKHKIPPEAEVAQSLEDLRSAIAEARGHDGAPPANTEQA